MKTQTLYIKNMVCDRCIRVVRDELEHIGVKVHGVILGEAVIGEPVQVPEKMIKATLEQNGFELIEDQRMKTIERIKGVIIDLIHHSDQLEKLKENYSRYIENRVGMEYQQLSRLFSSVENVTIEKYIIAQKIEKVKELLVYGELTLSEIGYRLGYSSVQHLSNQFKQVTGFTPTQFRSVKKEKRKSIDKVKG